MKKLEELQRDAKEQVKFSHLNIDSFQEHYKLYRTIYENYNEWYKDHENGKSGMYEPIENFIRITRQLLNKLPKSKDKDSLQALLEEIIVVSTSILQYFKGLNYKELEKNMEKLKGLVEKEHIILSLR